jgi:hypothetical protein
MIALGDSVGRGARNRQNDVALVQYLINANLNRLVPLRPLAVDGRWGTATEDAVRLARERLGIIAPGPWRNLETAPIMPGDPLVAELARAMLVRAPANLTAQFEEFRHQGASRQMAVGRITVNGNTYAFTSGGFGRGHLPSGTYTVTTHRQSRSETGFSSDGVGYTFALSDRLDPRVGNVNRTLLRIHPDGGNLGTQGCIGILGGAATQTSFRSGMNAEIVRHGNHLELTVRDP